MGLRSSGPLSRIFMDKWVADMRLLEEKTKILHQLDPSKFELLKIHLLVKYVDDVYTMLDRLRPGTWWSSQDGAFRVDTGAATSQPQQGEPPPDEAGAPQRPSSPVEVTTEDLSSEEEEGINGPPVLEETQVAPRSSREENSVEELKLESQEGPQKSPEQEHQQTPGPNPPQVHTEDLYG